MPISLKGILLTSLLVFTLFATAQVNTVSPYSRLGIGEIAAPGFARGLSLGGATLALNDPLNINLSNPASYTGLGLTTFELGFKFGFLEQVQETPSPLTVNNSSAGLRYFAVGVPLKSWWGSALALKPYSFRGYAISNSDSLLNDGEYLPIENRVEGEGGLTQVVWGNAFEVANGLSLGINAAFVFGRLEESVSTVINGNGAPYDTRNSEIDNLKGFVFEGGALYNLPLSNDRTLGLAATFTNASNLSAETTRLTYTYTSNNSTGIEIPIDSLISVSEQAGNYTLPGQVGLGFTYAKQVNPKTLKNAWLISGDYQMTMGSQFEDAYGDSQGLSNGFRAEFGGLIIPRYALKRLERNNKYWSAVEYRLGGFYENTPLNIRGTQITDYGITFGLGLPVRQRGLAPEEVKSSTINMGVVLGRRGTLESGLIQENYLNFFIGVTLNDKWFIKYKYR
jgi:hypothetical protein